MKTKFTFLVLLFAITLSNLYAQEKGKIVGKITDNRKMSLPGANVVVVGTTFGAFADMDGEYIIILPPGKYSISVSMMGYKPMTKTDVIVTVDKAARVDFALEEMIYEDIGITVIDQPLLLKRDVTSSTKSVALEEVSSVAVQNVQQAIEVQAGVTKSGNEIHIRGGRSDEVTYLVDGIVIKDPLAGEGRSGDSHGGGRGIEISLNTIKEMEVITGGFNPEYGDALSGVVKVDTQEGGEKSHGYVAYKHGSFNTDVFDISLEGELPRVLFPLPGRLFYFTNGHTYISDTYLHPRYTRKYEGIYVVEPNLVFYKPNYGQPTSAREKNPLGIREENDWISFVKLTWKISNDYKLSFSYSRSLKINQGFFLAGYGYPYKYQNILDNYNTFTQDGIITSLKWTHTLGPNTFYNIQFSRFFTNLHSDVQGRNWEDYETPVNTSGLPGLNNGFYDEGTSDFWHDHYVDTYTLKGDITHNIQDRHQFKSGLEMSYQCMQWIEIAQPTTGFNQDMYTAYPNVGALYIQDRFKYRGMTINGGFRFDYWFPGKIVEDAVNREVTGETILDPTKVKKQFYEDTFGFAGRRFKAQLSPRIGIAFPATDKDKLSFSYGYFSQRPQYQYVYTQLGAQTNSTYPVLGNPNLNPMTTVAYEMTVSHQFNPIWVTGMTIFYKDIFGYPIDREIILAGGKSYRMYFNQDYARSRGVEFELKRDYDKNISGSFNMSYSRANGKSSSSNTTLLGKLGFVSEINPVGEQYLRWDRPWKFTFNLNYRVKDKDVPELFGYKFPKNWKASLLWKWQSGIRYTPQENIVYKTETVPISETDTTKAVITYIINSNAGELYSKVAPPEYSVNLSLSKDFKFSGFNMSFVLDLENITNHRNVTRGVNPYTGYAWDKDDIIRASSGEIETLEMYNKYREEKYLNPSRLDKPRDIRFGVSVGW